MLEPIIVLTALNCFFMFSSTVTTCVLWRQYQSHRCCTKNDDIQYRKPILKKSKSATLQIPKKLRKSDGQVNVSKSSTNDSNKHRNEKCPKKKSRKRLQYLAAGYQKKKNDGQEALFSNEFDSRELNEKSKMSEASQTINDTKSTVVMEFSTVQKVVQIVDDINSDINSSRAPLKDIVIQKDTVTKKYDRSTERNFETNEAAVENSH